MNGNYVSLDIAKQEYCQRHQLVSKQDIDQVSLRYIGRNDNREYVFSVSAPFKGIQVNSIWGFERYTGEDITGRQVLGISREELTLTKYDICEFIRQRTGRIMTVHDIAKLVLNHDTIDVIFHPDSMTFKNSLTIKRI